MRLDEMELESEGEEIRDRNLRISRARMNRFELLIMSEAGKPIYSFSKREDAVTLMPLCSTLISYAKRTQRETLVSMKTSDNLVASFTTRSPLIIIVIHEANSYVDALILMEQVEAQIVSILTAKTLQTVFEERPTFDLKRLLYGSEKLIDSIANLSVTETKLEWPWVQAFLAVTASNPNPNGNLFPTSNLALPSRPHRVLVPIVSMPSNTRDTIHSLISNSVSSNSNNMVFSLLFKIVPMKDDDDDDSTTGIRELEEDQEEIVRGCSKISFRLITVCNHHSRHKLKIADIHLITALLDGSMAQLSSAESLWLPVCLPRFNQDAFLHSYISYTNKMRYCLVMLSVDRDEFSNCQKARNTIEEKLDSLLRDNNQKSNINHQMSPLVHPILLEYQEHCISNTLVGDELAEAQKQAKIYNSKVESYHARQLQFLWYQTSKQVLWWQRSAIRRPSPLLFYVIKKMLQTPLKTLWLKFANESVFLGWHVPTFQIYAQFDSTITTNEATEVIQRITNWIKKEEDNFSIKDYK